MEKEMLFGGRSLINISIIDDDRAMLAFMQKIVRKSAGSADDVSISIYERPEAFLEENKKKKVPYPDFGY